MKTVGMKDAYFEILSKNLKYKLQRINKYDDSSLELLFYKINKEVDNLTNDDLNKLKKEFEKKYKKGNEIKTDIITIPEGKDEKKINNKLLALMKKLQDKLLYYIEFREEALLGAYVFFLIAWFLISGFFHMGIASKIVSFVTTLVFFNGIDFVKNKKKLNSNKQISGKLRTIVLLTMTVMFFYLYPKYGFFITLL